MTDQAPALAISKDGQVLSIVWPDKRAAYHAIWLRDNGQDPQTRDPSNGQKRITVLDIPADTRLQSAHLDDDARIVMTFLPDRKSTWIAAAWLKQHTYDHATATPSLFNAELETWGSDLSGNIAAVSYTQAQRDPTALLTWLETFQRHGVGIMHGLAAKPQALLQAIDLFGYVRETNYGKCFEVRSQVDAINLAYTAVGLQVHSDNPYRDPVPTLQILACRQNTADGGDTIVVDGFRAAQLLLEESPEDFRMLSQHNADFEFAGASAVQLQSRRPMLELDPAKRLIGIRFNNRSCSALLDIPFDSMLDYYRAYRHFAEILERPQLAVQFRLPVNSMFMVNNLRVLHGRTRFSSRGTRWLQGAYADIDSLESTLRVLQNQVSAQNA